MSKITLYPYEIGRFIHEEGTKPYAFHLLLDWESLKAVGVIEKISGVFARYALPILDLKVSTLRKDKLVKIILIVNLEGNERLINQLVQMLKHQPHVKDVQYVPPIAEETAIDIFSFPLLCSGTRSVIFREPVYKGLIQAGWKKFGTPYAILLYEAGYESGRLAYDEHVKLVKEPDTIKMAQGLFLLLGFGRLEVVKLDDVRKEAVFKVHDSFECQIFHGVGEIRGNFIRGLVAGWLSGHWKVSGDEQVFVREVKCVAKGDPYCEYIAYIEKTMQ